MFHRIAHYSSWGGITEMSSLCQTTKDLVKNYDNFLEQRLAEGASSLTCDNEVLCQEAQAILENAGAENMHSLGLDPLRVMEESLKATAALPVSPSSPCRRGLRGLAKAFEVLEQATLNLYLNPWREEFKVVKMYSGVFTHCIKPVLSAMHIAKLFGLLGYQPCVGQQDQLLRGRSTSPDLLLQLSCGFFLARCECRLLLAALGGRGGEAEWELGVVMERRRGHSLQVALDNTAKSLDTHQTLTEEVPVECGAGGELELDLYTAESLKSGQGEAAAAATAFHDDHGAPRSLSWETNHLGRSPASSLLTHSNGFSIPSAASSTSAGAAAGVAAAGSRSREPRCVTVLNCHLSKTSPPRQVPSGATRTPSAATKQAPPPDEDSPGRYDRNEDRPPGGGMIQPDDQAPPEPEPLCGCVQAGGPRLKSCSAAHVASCPSLRKGRTNGHTLAPLRKTAEAGDRTRPVSSQGLHEPGWSAAPQATDPAAMSLLLCSPTEPLAKPPQLITYHSCCDQTLDPQNVCLSCKVFHSGACREWRSCEQRHHDVKPLRVCSCGMACPRKPLVLCRYCGREYCNNCWYRNPVTCACGETLSSD